VSKKWATWRKAFECTLPMKPDPIIATFNLVLDMGTPIRPAKLPRTARMLGKELRQAVDLAAPQGFEPR
jgi:hypothetical protein